MNYTRHSLVYREDLPHGILWMLLSKHLSYYLPGFDTSVHIALEDPSQFLTGSYYEEISEHLTQTISQTTVTL